MALARTAQSFLPARSSRPAGFVPFRSNKLHAAQLRCHAASNSSSSHTTSAADVQPIASTSAPESALFLARSVLQSAGEGARELLASPYSIAAVAALLLYLAPTDAATAADAAHQHQPLYTIAEGGEDFWVNVARYARYFVTVLLGTGYVMVKPVLEAFKKPGSAIVAVGVIVGGTLLLKFTLNAMLGIEEPFIYEPGNIVPYSP